MSQLDEKANTRRLKNSEMGSNLSLSIWLHGEIYKVAAVARDKSNLYFATAATLTTTDQRKTPHG